MEEDSTKPIDSNEKYSSHKDDPVYLLSFIDKYVKVKLIKTLSLSGFVNCIDHNTNSVLLSVPENDTFKLKLLPGHAIIDMYELPSSNIQLPSQSMSEADTEQEILSRKTKLIAWFKFNLLPVFESEDKIVVKSANVLPPYKTFDIYADNPVIALQIRKIMERMPKDFDG